MAKAKAKHAREVRSFTDIPNVGEAMAGDFRALGFARPQELAGQDALALYRRLCALTNTRQDPCVLDTFLAVVDFMDGGAPRPWWDFTAERKKRHPDL
ncbi:MAG: helix-hairpin-helix domain-containing protein [Polyangiales bacterium]